jgi:hypothetical protein
MAARLVDAGAADADGRTGSNGREEFDGLAASGIGKQFAFVTIKLFLECGERAMLFLLDFSYELCAGREHGEPDVKVIVHDPAVFGNAARREARNANAKALPRLRRCAYLEGSEVKLGGHKSHFSARDHPRGTTRLSRGRCVLFGLRIGSRLARRQLRLH